MIVTVRAAARPVRLVQRPLPQARDASSSIYSQRHQRPRSQLQPAPANPLNPCRQDGRSSSIKSKEDAREEKPPSNRRPSTRSSFCFSFKKNAETGFWRPNFMPCTYVYPTASAGPQTKAAPATGSQLILYFCMPFRQKGVSPCSAVLGANNSFVGIKQSASILRTLHMIRGTAICSDLILSTRLLFAPGRWTGG